VALAADVYPAGLEHGRVSAAALGCKRLSERPSLIWNAASGLIIALSFLRWLLQR